MSILLFCFITLMTGCVPLVQYEMLEHNLSAVKAEKNIMKKKLDSCGEQNKKMVEALKVRPPVAAPVSPEELDGIKKQALEEAEGKFKARVKKNNIGNLSK